MKQWEIELILDLINDKLEEVKGRPVWTEQLTELKETILNTEYIEEEPLTE